MFVRITVAIAVLLGASIPTPAAAAKDPVADSWSAVGTFRTADGWYASPVHASVLPSGKILFIGIAYQADPATPTTRLRRVSWLFDPPAAGAPIPASTTIDELAQPAEYTDVNDGTSVVSDDLICAAQVLDAQGRLITAGGTRSFTNLKTGTYVVFGLPYLTRYDQAGWVRTKQLLGHGTYGKPSRWYPTATRLPSGKILIIGGLEMINKLDPAKPSATFNTTLETYDPVTGAQELVSTRTQTPPEIHARDYAHSFVLPYPQAAKDLLIIGESGRPVVGKSTTPGSYATLPRPRPGGSDPSPNYGASTVQLPMRTIDNQWGYRNGSVLTVSGTMDTPNVHSGDVFDVLTGAWRSPRIELTTPRHHPSTVLLPDGRVLVINGHDMMGDLGVQRAQYIDPRNHWAVTTGATPSGVVRGYHSVAVLLPDGRVFVGGGRDQVTETSREKPTWQIYQPDYPTGAAPSLVATPPQLDYGSVFQVSAVGPESSELLLLGLGSMTHSFDLSQREVQLPIAKTYSNDQGARLSIVGAPANAHVAPPGYYWLYGLSASGAPSSAKLVHVG